MRGYLSRAVSTPALGVRHIASTARRSAEAIDGKSEVGSIHASSKGLFTLVLPLRPLSPHFQQDQAGKAIRFQLHPKQPLSCVSLAIRCQLHPNSHCRVLMAS